MHRLRPGDRRRGRAPLTCRLLVRGRGERRLDPEVRADELRAHSSTRRPFVQRGDSAILYAAWRFSIRPRLGLRDLRDAPPVEAAGVMARSLGRHSYIRLTEEQFEAGRRAIEDATQ